MPISVMTREVKRQNTLAWGTGLLSCYRLLGIATAALL